LLGDHSLGRLAVGHNLIGHHSLGRLAVGNNVRRPFIG
jgi:hypothetical protein